MMERACHTCRKLLPPEAFYRNSDRKDGFSSRCKQCMLTASRKWQAEHPERVREINRRSCLKRREHRIQKSRAYYQANTNAMKKRVHDYMKRLKDEAYSKYGGYRCACCGETLEAFLCLHHINNDGHEHRKHVPPSRLYKWLKDNSYPQIMQVLCYNCNIGMKVNKGICPHLKAAYGLKVEER